MPSSADAVVKVSVVLVAPERFVNVPPSPLACHCTVGAGLPLAVALNETELPAQTARFVGLTVTAGGVLTVIVALPVPTCVQEFASATEVTV